MLQTEFEKLLSDSLRNHPDDWEITSSYLQHIGTGVKMLMDAIIECKRVVVFGPGGQTITAIQSEDPLTCYKYHADKWEVAKNKESQAFLDSFKGF